MPFHFVSILIFAVTGIGFVLATLTIMKFLRPNYPTEMKSAIYECGEKPFGDARFNFNPRFYLVALVFVIFEVEIAFMFPVALVFRKWVLGGNGVLAFWEIFVFAIILIVGLAYVWVMGDLDWIKTLAKEPPRSAKQE